MVGILLVLIAFSWLLRNCLLTSNEQATFDVGQKCLNLEIASSHDLNPIKKKGNGPAAVDFEHYIIFIIHILRIYIYIDTDIIL